jgi:hypothetical protein
MFSDPLINIVHRLRQRGSDPRRIGQNAWEAICPACRSDDRALLLHRGSLATCRSRSRCPEHRVLAALGLAGQEVFNPTPRAAAREFAEIPIEPATFGVPKPLAQPIAAPQETTEPLPETDLQTDEADDDQRPLEQSDRPIEEHACEPELARPAVMADPECGARPGQGDSESEVPAEEPCATECTTAPTLDPVVAAPCLGPASQKAPPPPARRRRRTAAHAAAGNLPKKVSLDELLAKAGVRRTFRASDGRYYSTVSVDRQVACYPLESDELDRLLVRRHHELTGRGPSPAFRASLLAMLRARAEINDHSEPVFVRVASRPPGDDCVIDLGDCRRRAVEISASGWQLVDHSGVNFWRPSGLRALPEPARGGAIDEILEFVNIEPADMPLLIVWLTAALRPDGPYPILVINGEEGTAKTTAALVCRRLIDPHATLLRSFPKTERDLMIAAHHNWLLAFDNLSSLAPWQSDALCRLSTGGGFGSRQWFSNDHEVVIHAQRPIVVGGIDDFVHRGDLADRCIFLHLPPIPPPERMGDREFWARFKEACPRLLGALFDAVAGGIRLWPEVRLPELSRMADVDRWGESVARALGHPPGTFLSAYRTNRKSACQRVLEDVPVFAALTKALDYSGLIEGTPTEVLLLLTDHLPFKQSALSGWPRSPVAFSRLLQRMAPQLRAIGIIVGFHRPHHGRIITITRNAVDD